MSLEDKIQEFLNLLPKKDEFDIMADKLLHIVYNKLEEFELAEEEEENVLKRLKKLL